MLVPSLHRPIPLVRRSDLQYCETSLRGEDHIVVKDPIEVRYYLIPRLQFRILEALDGRRSLSEIHSQVQDEGLSTAVEAPEVFRLIMDLASKQLIWSQRAGTSARLWARSAEQRWQEFWGAIRNPLFIRLPGVHPGQAFHSLSRSLGWIYSRPALVTATLFIGGTWLFLLLHLDALLQEVPAISRFATDHGLWSLWIVVGVLKILHELSHGIACERFGAECQSTGVAFLFFSPCMYCDVTDAWMLPRKSHRMAVSLAGVYVELIVSALALWLWWLSAPGLFHQFCLLVFLAGSIATLLFNANPLLRFDGYYVLADLLEIPNLYYRSRQSVKRMAARLLLGIRLPGDLKPESPEPTGILVTYGLASMTYQLPMLLGMGLFLYGLLEPIGLAAVVWFGLLVTAMVAAIRFLTWSTRMIRVQKSPTRTLGHTLISGAFVAAILAAIWLCPLGSTVTVPAIVEPQFIAPVYVDTPGTVRTVEVREGDVVQQGTVLVELENLELDRRLVAMEGILATHETDFRWAQANGDPDMMLMAKTAVESTNSLLENALREKERLLLRASVSGTVISARRQQSVTQASMVESIEESTGILNPRLIGTTLPRNTCLCEIAPSPLWQAAIWVDQRGRQYLTPGQHVDVCLDAFSGTPLPGKVVAIGAANELEVPAVLSTRFGGSIITSPGSAGDVPQEPVYRATVVLEESALPIRRGMRGTGRFTRTARTVGAWLTDEFHRVFVVR